MSNFQAGLLTALAYANTVSFLCWVNSKIKKKRYLLQTRVLKLEVQLKNK